MDATDDRRRGLGARLLDDSPYGYWGDYGEDFPSGIVAEGVLAAGTGEILHAVAADCQVGDHVRDSAGGERVIVALTDEQPRRPLRFPRPANAGCVLARTVDVRSARAAVKAERRKRLGRHRLPTRAEILPDFDAALRRRRGS